MDGDAFRWEVDRLLEQAMLGSGGLAEYLDAVVSVAAGAIGVAGSYSLITTAPGGGTAAATSDGGAPPAGPTFATGPAAAALHAGGRAQVDDLSHDGPVPGDRSPGWPPAALASGFRSAACAVARSGADERPVALAFDHLRRTSQDSNVKLRTLAAQILEGYPGATAASPPLSLRPA